MKTTLILTVLLAAASAARAQEPPGPPSAFAGEALTDASMLRLRDGGILWGSITEHTPEGLRFRRLDNGGTVGLRWSHLDPSEERELRTRFGYVEAGVDEMMVAADRIRLTDGTELVGLITERTPTELWLKTAEGRLPIPLRRIAGPASIVRVPALDVHTKDELYQQRVMELSSALQGDGPEAAEAHFEVARFCEQLLDYEKALQHYEAVARIDPDYRADSMEAILARAEEKAAVQEQVDLLRQIDLWRARGRYDKATTELALFAELYPRSPLTEDLNQLRERVYESQLRDLKEEVVRSWHHWTQRLARTAAYEMGYEEALAYLDGQMSEDVLTKVHEDLTEIAPELQRDEVRPLWEERDGGKRRQASYGNGTWLLGEARARAGIEADEEEADTPAERGSRDEARQKLEEKLQRYLKNQEIAKRAAAGGESEEEDPSAFWERWSAANRTQWVRAYYAENSGDFEIEKIRFRNCRECGGTGTRRIVFTGGAAQGAQSGERLVPCPTCHHIGVVRLVKYR